MNTSLLIGIISIQVTPTLIKIDLLMSLQLTFLAFYYNFDAYTDGPVTDFGIPYDPFSLMHYSKYAFSTNEDTSIDLRDGVVEFEDERLIGQRDHLTDSDIAKLNAMYECY